MNQSESLEHLRQEIEKIDKKILNLLSQRITLVKKIGYLKNELDLPIYDKKRESFLLKNITHGQHELVQHFLKKIFLEIFKFSRKIQADQKEKK